MRDPRLALALVASAAGCGVSLAGSGPTGFEGSVDAATADAVAETNEDSGAAPADASTPDDVLVSDAPPAPDGACAPPACASAPAGFTSVAFAESASACPAQFDAVPLRENPTLGADACTCAHCTTANLPNCTIGAIPAKVDNGSGSCETTGATIQGNGGACTAFSDTMGVDSVIFAPAPAFAGTCASEVLKDVSGVKTDAVQVCVPKSACVNACDPSLGSGFRACYRASGDVSCPASAPNKHLVGASVDLTCGTCACSLTTECTGSAVFYDNSACDGGALITLQAGASTRTSNTQFRAYAWRGATQATCSVTGPSPGSAAFADVSTICCP